MPRRQPISTKQKKAQLQLKRAVKRGEVSLPGSSESQAQIHSYSDEGLEQGRPGPVIRKNTFKQSAQRLESSFLKVHPGFLEGTKLLASVSFLPRPLSPSTAILSESDILCNSDDITLRCPKRPRWRVDMTKKQVEANEESMFRQWLTETDECIFRWWSTGERSIPKTPEAMTDSNNPVYNQANAPVYYERNLQVWRQLWRVTEISHILLVLLDSRCPAVHFPPSLQHYILSLAPTRPLVFVLTKTDMVPRPCVSAWEAWLQTRHPNSQIINVRSYRTIDTVDVSFKGRTKHEPCIRDDDFSQLVLAIQRSYEKLITPPEKIQHDPQKLKIWESTREFPINLQLDPAQLRDSHRDGKPSEKALTIGLIGQPNVGKSSLLNAIFGTHKVKASRTPGKTKHLQTLFWTSDIRLVDCPGLVFPNFVRMELQVLSGVLPISQISSISACMHYALRLLPLENILKLECPSENLPNTGSTSNERTWREARITQRIEPIYQWTTMDVLTAFAAQKSWVTAKAGRPDVNRAGNYILRSLAEGRIKWSFWPPSTKNVPATDDSGIWSGGDDLDENFSETTESDQSLLSDDARSPISDSEVSEDLERTFGRFHALALDDPQEEFPNAPS